MFSAEQPRSENPSADINPEKGIEAENNLEKAAEQAVDTAMSEVEDRDATDPVISSGWTQKAKEFLKGKTEELKGRGKEWTDRELNVKKIKQDLKDTAKATPRFLWDSLVVGTSIIVKFKFGIFEFVKKLIQKKGQITFKEGYEVGKEVFSFDTKKEKK